MAKNIKAKNIKIDITNEETIFINGSTGEQLSPQEFRRRHAKGVRSILGGNRIKVRPAEEKEGTN